MGGAKESLTEITSGRTLLQVQLQRLTPHFQEVLVLVGPDARSSPIPNSAERAKPIWDPPEHSGHGPLAGLLAGLLACRTDWLALLAVDTPFFPPEAFGQALERAPGGCQALGFVGPEGRPQWLPGLYRPALHSSVEEALGWGERSLGRWMQAREHAFLPWIDSQVPASRAFANLNTPEAARQAGFQLCK
jgi:molybdopterin-guanine dinucleotide biosynthesis protein A